MIRRFVRQMLVSLAVFAGVLFAFSRVDWMQVFGLDHGIIEEKLGEMYWELFSESEVFVDDDTLIAPLDTLFSALCQANGIDRNEVALHLVECEEVNAYACPGNHLVVYTALVAECRSEAELCGILAHELAHIERGHVMQKLVKELGVATLAAMLADGGALTEVMQVLTSTAYDRTLEAEADDVAVHYLLAAGIDPRSFGDFLLRLSQEEDLPALAEWISTHPDSKKRVQAIYTLAEGEGHNSAFRSLMPEDEWEAYRLRFVKVK